jgi:hypothetical protein
MKILQNVNTDLGAVAGENRSQLAFGAGLGAPCDGLLCARLRTNC